jgi:hypothetical protein
MTPRVERVEMALPLVDLERWVSQVAEGAMVPSRVELKIGMAVVAALERELLALEL